MDNPYRKAMKTLPGHVLRDGHYGDGYGNRCILGHVAHAKGLDDFKIVQSIYGTINDEIVALETIFHQQFPHADCTITMFNDCYATEEDLMMLLEKAAVQWDETQGLTD